MVMELPLRSQPREGVLPLWTQPLGWPLPPAQLLCPVFVSVGMDLGAGLGRADQGNNLSLGYRKGQG